MTSRKVRRTIEEVKAGLDAARTAWAEGPEAVAEYLMVAGRERARLRADAIRAKRDNCPDCGGEPHFHFCGGERRGGSNSRDR